MPWDRTAPSNPKYRTPEHRRERARWAAELKRAGSVQCAQPECVMDERTIWQGDDWHLGHADDGVTYIGPVHPECNVRDGARRARARQDPGYAPRRWPL